MRDRSSASPTTPSPVRLDHRDDIPAGPPLPRPGRMLVAAGHVHRATGIALNGRVTNRALTQARSTLATAEQQLAHVHGNRAWRLGLRVDSAKATLRAAAPCPSCGGAGGRTVDTSSGGVQRQHWQTCGTCRGTGTC